MFNKGLLFFYFEFTLSESGSEFADASLVLLSMFLCFLDCASKSRLRVWFINRGRKTPLDRSESISAVRVKADLMS